MGEVKETDRSKRYWRAWVEKSYLTAAVGATFDNTARTQAGAIYVFVRSNGEWIQEAKLIGSDTASGDQFGRFVSISGQTVVVSSHLDDDGGTNSGAAYVYNLSADS